MKYFRSLKSEWIKTRRSAASWLCLIGGFFIPIIWLIVFLKDHTSINNYQIEIWQRHFMRLWQNMAFFLLPMGAILASSLITQMEFKNNTWKQLHTTPQSLTTVFLSKFSVILLLTIKFFVFFNIGIILSAIIPTLLFEGKLPIESIPVTYILKWDLKFFIAILPIVAIQYLISLNFKNFLVPIGVGLVLTIGSLIGMKWEYIYFSPYSFCVLLMMPLKNSTLNMHLVALLHFIVIMTVSYVLYIRKKEKG